MKVILRMLMKLLKCGKNRNGIHKMIYRIDIVVFFIMKAEDEWKGFLITCDKNKEKQAIKDAYNFLS